jgi:hypothetical protein
MDLTALTWQASVVLIYVSFNREAGVANATLASFFVPTTKPSKPSTRITLVGCVLPNPLPRVRPRRICAVAAHLSGKNCNPYYQTTTSKCSPPRTGRAPAVPSLQSMPGASPRATASIRADVDAGDTSGGATLLLCKARASPNVTDVGSRSATRVDIGAVRI